MKIAIISDIHANTEALEAVLEKINSIGVDKIFCLGDILMAGYDPNGTGKIIFDLVEKMGENFEIIQGNTDRMLSFPSQELLDKVKENFPAMGFALEDDLKITEKKYIDFVKNLPENKYVEINGLKIQLVHGSPRKQDENIYPNLDMHKVEEMTEVSEAQVILCGHTHIPCGYSLPNGKTVINAGSVGRSMSENKMPYFALLKVNQDSTFQIEHICTKYDNKKVSGLVRKRGFKHAEDLAQMFI